MELIRQSSSSSSGSPRTPKELPSVRRGRSRKRTTKVCRTYSGAVTTVPKKERLKEAASLAAVKEILLSGEALYSTAPFVKRSLAGVLFGGAEEMTDAPDELFPSFVHRGSKVVETEQKSHKRSFSEPFQNTWTPGGDFEIAGLMSIPVLVGGGTTHIRDVATAGSPITLKKSAIVCEAKADGATVIVAGSVDDLIDELVFQATGADPTTYAEVFVNTHESFCSPQHLFERLLQHMEDKIPKPSERQAPKSCDSPPAGRRSRVASHATLEGKMGKLPASKLPDSNPPPDSAPPEKDAPKRSLSAKRLYSKASSMVRSNSADFAEISEIQRLDDSADRRASQGSSNLLAMLNKSDIKKLKQKITGKVTSGERKPLSSSTSSASKSYKSGLSYSKAERLPDASVLPSVPDLDEINRPGFGLDGREGSGIVHSNRSEGSATDLPSSRGLMGGTDEAGQCLPERAARQEPMVLGLDRTVVCRSKSDGHSRRRRLPSVETEPEDLSTFMVADSSILKQRVVNVLRTWIKYQHWVLSDKRTRKALSSAVRRINAMGKTEEKWASQLHLIMKDKSRAWASANLCQSPRAHAIVSMTSVLEIPPHELARQMTIVEHVLFKDIDPGEYLHGRYAVPERSPGLRRFIRCFNRRTDWVCSEVLLAQGTKQRAAVIARFIRVAEQCQRLGNFNGLMEVVSALQTISIERLTKTWKLVPRLEMDCFEVLRAMMDSRGNFKTYRAVLERTALPVLPFQSVIVKDLTFVEENASMLEDGKVNFYKFWVMGTVLAQIRSCQEVPYNLKEVPVVQRYLTKFRVLSEDEQYEASTQLEPIRKSKEEKKPRRKEVKSKPKRSTSKGKSSSIDAHEGASLAPGSFGAHVAGMRGSSSSSNRSRSSHSRSRSRDAATDDEISDSNDLSLRQQLHEERSKRMELEQVNAKLEEALYSALKKKNPYKVPKSASPQDKLHALQALIQHKEQEILALRGQYDALVATLITSL